MPVASLRRSGINGNFFSALLSARWIPVSLLFGEVELMETSLLMMNTSCFFKSLLFGEVELMETMFPSYPSAGANGSLLFGEVELMETSRTYPRHHLGGRVASLRRSGINGNQHC